MNILPFKAAFPKVDLITSPKAFFSNIKFQYREYRRSGFYDRLEKEAVYIYQVHSAHGKHTGIICNTDVKCMKKGEILKHEKTLASKEQQMMHLLLKRKALVKPVLLAYNPVPKINTIIKDHIKKNEPNVDVLFDDKIERHIIWAVHEQDKISKLQKLFAKVPSSYIGDGHHRSTTIALLSRSKDLGEEARKYDQLLTAYFPFNELEILDYNRVVDINEIMEGTLFMAQLSKYFDIEKMNKAAKPKQKHVVTMYIKNSWYKLKWKEEYLSTKNTKGPLLDSALLNQYVFGKILGIKDVRVDSRIKYYSGLESLKKIPKQVNRTPLSVGFCIRSVTAKELTDIADKGQTLPPKSTWFEPRLVSGILTKDL
jgi:uncharacterized protein (DUF1015 family)